MFSTTRELPVITTLELPAIIVDGPDNRSGKLGGALRNPLYRSGYALVVNTAGTTAVGVAYWAIAAHLYDKAAVGRSSALISALILLSSLAQLNLASALPRFLPQSGRRAGRLIGYSYGVSAAAALLGAVLFVLVIPRLSSQWEFLGNSAAVSLLFVAAAVVWGVFALEDAALTGLQQAVVVPLENTVYGVAKLGMLLAVAALLPASGIFVSWVIPLVLIVPAINWLIFRRYARTGRFAVQASTVTPREIARFASIDYLGALLAQAYGNLLPLLVLSALGASANGGFYIAWTITSGLSLVAVNFGTSLLVEASAAPHRLAELTRGVLVRSLAVTVAGAFVLIILAHPILAIYGGGYTHVTGLLALLATATLPRSFVQLTWTLDRVAGRVGRAAFTQLVLAILVLGGSWLLLHHHLGSEGVGLAWTAGNMLIAVVRLPTVIGAATRRSNPGRDHRGERARLTLTAGTSLGQDRTSPAHGRNQRRQPGRHRASAS